MFCSLDKGKWSYYDYCVLFAHRTCGEYMCQYDVCPSVCLSVCCLSAESYAKLMNILYIFVLSICFVYFCISNSSFVISVSMSICLLVFFVLFVGSFVYLSVIHTSMFVYRPVYVYICLSDCRSVCLSVYFNRMMLIRLFLVGFCIFFRCYLTWLVLLFFPFLYCTAAVLLCIYIEFSSCGC